VIDLVIKKHLNNFDSQQKIVLTDLCNLISDELPTATQTIKYGIPTFLIEGVAIIGFDGYKKHNSLFPYSGSTNMLLQEAQQFVSLQWFDKYAVGKGVSRVRAN